MFRSTDFLWFLPVYAVGITDADSHGLSAAALLVFSFMLGSTFVALGRISSCLSTSYSCFSLVLVLLPIFLLMLLLYLCNICRILSMYDIKDEDIDVVVSQSQLSTTQSTPLQLQLPVIELLKVS